MVQICDESLKIEGKSIEQLAAELTVLLEIVSCARMLETGKPSAGCELVDMIAVRTKAGIADPKNYIWEEAKNIIIEMLRRDKNGAND